SPPATDTWAPMRTSEQVEQESDLAAAPGLLAAARALLPDPAAHREHDAGLEAGGAQAGVGLLLGEADDVGHLDQVGALADAQDHRRPPGHLGTGAGGGAHRLSLWAASPGCPATSGTWTLGLPALTTTVTTRSAPSTVPGSGRVAMTAPLATVRLVLDCWRNRMPSSFSRPVAAPAGRRVR